MATSQSDSRITREAYRQLINRQHRFASTLLARAVELAKLGQSIVTDEILDEAQHETCRELLAEHATNSGDNQQSNEFGRVA